MRAPSLGLISGILRVDCRVLTFGLARVFHRFRKRRVQLEAGETDRSISHPRTGRGDTATRRLLR